MSDLKPTTQLAHPEQYTLLVVDDNQTNVRVIMNYLREAGFKLLVAKDGLMALEVVQSRKPDLILLDVMMPEMDGFETCRRLKADEETRHIPVIFMTALTSEDDKVKGFDVGAVDYVTKPIQQREVLARVYTHLQIRQQSKLLQQQYQEMEFLAYQLATTNADKDKFFSIVAHDLRGPFLPLLGNLELMTEMAESLPPKQMKEMSAASHRSARRVFELLENLLHWARLQMGRMEYQPQQLDLGKIAAKNVELLSENAVTKQINLSNEVKSNTLVYADEQMLNTVIRNLTNNALKFTPPGGQVTIVASFELENKLKTQTPTYVTVSITDTGVGMPPEVKQKLFKLDEHVTTIGTGKETGTGLGLIICQEMVIKSGGQIWVESELGKGTTVKFTLPVA
jgi:signal transduction histidine kinase